MFKWALCGLFLVATVTYVADDAAAGPRGGGGRAGRAGGGRPGGIGSRPGGGSRGTARNFSKRGGVGEIGNRLEGTGDGLREGELRRSAGDLAEQFGVSGEQLNDLKGQAQSFRNNFTPENEPFTPAWYADHPNAWRYTHPHADAWAAATAAGVTAWLGWPVVDYGYATSGDDPYVADEAPAEEENATNAPAEEQGPTAGELAISGAGDLSNEQQWMPLGVYALAPEGQNQAAQMLQLAVNKQGKLRGNYYDLISDNGAPIQGALDKSTQRAAWTVGKSGRTTFETTLSDLTAEDTPLTIHFPGGNAQRWQMVRLQSNDGDEPTTNDDK